MRERLIQLISNADEECKHSKDCKSCSGYGKGSQCMNYHIADYLIENGVVLLPCKVGDVVYIIDEGNECTEPYVLDVTVTTIGYDICGFWITMNLPLSFKMSAHIGESSFGKTVFITREEAEAKLKGGGE